MGKVKTIHEPQIRGEKNKATAWGKKEDEIMYCHNSGSSRSKSVNPLLPEINNKHVQEHTQSNVKENKTTFFKGLLCTAYYIPH